MTDFRYWAIGGEVYYVPTLIKGTALGIGAVLLLTSPLIVVGLVAWAFM